jgi:hypothetical protein
VIRRMRGKEMERGRREREREGEEQKMVKPFD